MNKTIITKSIACLFGLAFAAVAQADEAKPLTSAQVLEQSKPSDWRKPDPANIAVMELEQGLVVMELAPHFAPNHVANFKQLVKQNYFDGLAVIRSHDNYVAQWGDPASEPENARSLGEAKEKLAPEFELPIKEVDFTPIVSRDAYADTTGFSRGFAAAQTDGDVWLTHCYGALGAGRGMEPDSGNSSSLYVVTGHAPRHLDKNVTLLGRVIQGIEHLTSLPRGTGTLGFYEDPSQNIPIKSIRLGSDADDLEIEVLRTDTELFDAYVKARTHRHGDWWLDAAGKIDVCNVGIPVRSTAKEEAES